MDQTTCQTCGKTVDETNKCACNPNLCKEHCGCADDCACGCKKPVGDDQTVDSANQTSPIEPAVSNQPTEPSAPPTEEITPPPTTPPASDVSDPTQPPVDKNQSNNPSGQ